MKILIAIRQGEKPRSFIFNNYLAAMNLPPNTIIQSRGGQSPAQTGNHLIKVAIKNNCTHIFFLDDDMIVKKDTLTSLVKHDKQIVSGLYLTRWQPHRPIAFDQINKGLFRFMDLTGKSGLIRVLGAGLGCVLFNLEVFKKLEYPWIRIGELDKEDWSDDTGLYYRCADAGIEMYMDLDVTIGHITEQIVWPVQMGNTWMGTFSNTGDSVSHFILKMNG